MRHAEKAADKLHTYKLVSDIVLSLRGDRTSASRRLSVPKFKFKFNLTTACRLS